MTRRAAMFICLFMAMLTSSSALAADGLEVPLWDGGAPATAGKPMHETINNWGGVEGTYQPELIVYLPEKAKATGTAVMICPGGGGFKVLAMKHEGRQVASYLQSIGMVGIICKYRLRDEGEDLEKAADHVLIDTQRGMRQIRAHAQEWNIDPHRVGVMGFSMGGVAVLNLVTHPGQGDSDAKDAVDRLDCRPDFMILSYPGVPDAALAKIDDKVPPALLVHAMDDPWVPCSNSRKLFDALYQHNVAAELHIFSGGGHGFGIGQPTTPDLWPVILKDWLTRKAFTKSTTQPAPPP